MKIQTQESAALKLTGQIAANAALAAPILELLEAVQNDPTRLAVLTKRALEPIQAELPVVKTNELSIQSATRTYDDNRAGFRAHQAIDFTVSLTQPYKAKELLTGLLGKADADILISDWGSRINFGSTVPDTNKAVLFVNSNNKARNKDYAERGAKTTQEDDFKAAGLEFADDLQATIVCATLVDKAKKAGLDMSKDTSSWKSKQASAVAQLGEAEFELLAKLRDGVVRSRSGALYVNADGRFRAHLFDDSSFSDCWAFGGGSPAESK